jgi:6-pyruvoyltetrahydropterin/6-carboxytetrahydropterin synthase
MSFLTTLHLAKQNFKFSAAHFLIFNDHEAERLHGHNYKVRVEIDCPSDQGEDGYFVDFNVLKKTIKSKLDEWDERVILPERHKDIRVDLKPPSLHLTFRDRVYTFPANEVVLLPVTNTSVEQLSGLLAEIFMKEFSKFNITKIRLNVEESEGQGAWAEISKKV